MIEQTILNMISKVKSMLSNEPYLGEVFENCYRDTLEKTITMKEDSTAYVITGDIPAMWLRDSAAQLRPYLPLTPKDPEITELIAAVVRRQFQCINIDPYANAFNETANGACWSHDEPACSPWVWERKYEIDSLCYPLQLAWLLWKSSGYTGHFDRNFINGAKKILKVFRTEQHHEEKSDYYFRRENTYFHDTLSRDGHGNLVKSGIGLIWSGFRPSDDACTFGYLIPSNMFAVVVLRYLEEIAREVLKKKNVNTLTGENNFQNEEPYSLIKETTSLTEEADFLVKEAVALADEIYEAIESIGIVEKEGFGKIYAYETDGYGQYNLMDDANIPSLLSMKYLGYVGKNPEIAENTRRFILSEGNPYFYRGTAASGIGSPHTPVCNIWHMALAMQGITSDSPEEKLRMLKLMTATDAGCGMMHESFHMDDPTQFSRSWFSWANAMYCHLVMDYLKLI